MEMEMVKKWMMEGRVGMGMVVVQGITTGLQLLARVILSEGTFVFALMAYRHVVAAFAVLPFALYFERGAVKKLSIAAFFWLFMVALTGNTGTPESGWQDENPRRNVMPCGSIIYCPIQGNSFHLTHHYHNHGHKIISKTNKNKTRGTMFLVGSCLSAGTLVHSTGTPVPGDWLGIFSFLPFSTRLIGMGLIIAGLYSFLWGKSKDTKPTLLPIKESGAGGGGDAAPESAGLPSSATIVPAASPNKL
ncbi:UNVERIFIED_CONTAM: hypothetical protein Sradi_6636900 [Sesamum radiatum]|uniref:WAT1-related protein n=1 Tax=Sesamum radiatum TaxID=300843 RepID=A0AAW2K1N4_SESRA